MIDFRWLSDSLCDVLRWQRANPGGEDGPEVPTVGRRVWSIFLGLDATRTVGMAANPISFGEIEIYSRARREPVRPFEVTMLRALDISGSGTGGQSIPAPAARDEEKSTGEIIDRQARRLS